MTAPADRPVAILLSPVVPAPTGSGRAMRAWSWLTELAEAHEVHVVVPEPNAAADASPIALPTQAKTTLWRCGTGVDVSRRMGKLVGLLLPPLALVSSRLALDWHHSTEQEAFATGLRRALAHREVARIVVFRHYLAELGQALAADFPTAWLELDLDDLESQARLSLAGAQADLGRHGEAAAMLASSLQYRLLEARLPGPFAAIHVAADEDREALRRRGIQPVSTRPNRIALPAASPQPNSAEIQLLFVGTLNYPPNEQAVRRLVRGIVPILRRRLSPGWRLVIAGRHAEPNLVAELRATAEIDFVADADDLSGLYRQAHMALVPLQAGGGTKLKTLEAFANRRPVVSTPQGVRGLAAIPGRDFVPAETDEAFVEAIVGLAHDRDRADRIATAGWELCRSNYAA